MKESLFMGKITATATHEIKNVLAIINESSGLMQDFLSMVSDETFKYRERFLKIIGKIEEQVARGDEISTLLNRFAHAPDNELASENVSEMVDQMIALSGRLAKAREVTFHNESSDGLILLNGDPIKTRMLIFQAMEVFMNQAARGSKVSLRVLQGQGRNVLIEFCVASDKTDAGWMQTLGVCQALTDLKKTVVESNSVADFEEQSGTLKLEMSNLELNLF